MKKGIALLLVIVMAVSFAACGKNAEGESSTAKNTAAESQNNTNDTSFVFPAKKLTLHIASAAGGGFDMSARTFTAEWGEKLGTTIEYIYHDSDSCYMEAVNEITSTRKGEYAIMMGFDEALQSMFAFNETPFTRDQVAVIGGIYSDANVVMARSDDDRFNNMDELFTYAEGAKSPVTISTPSPLSPANMNATILVAASGMNANVVAYSGGSGARNDLIGGHVDLSVGSLETANNISEQVKVLGILSDNCEIPEHFSSAQLLSEFAKSFEMPDLSSHCYLWCDAKLAEEEPDVYQALIDTLQVTLTEDEAVQSKMAEINRAGQFTDAATCQAQSDSVNQALEEYAEMLDPKLQ